MKKIFAVFLTIFSMAYFSMPAFASCNGTWTDFTNDTDVKLSANVYAKYCGGTSGSSYSAATYNPLGTGKAYGIASDTTSITYANVATNGDSSTIPSLTHGDSRDVTGNVNKVSWTQLGKD